MRLNLKFPTTLTNTCWVWASYAAAAHCCCTHLLWECKGQSLWAWGYAQKLHIVIVTIIETEEAKITLSFIKVSYCWCWLSAFCCCCCCCRRLCWCCCCCRCCCWPLVDRLWLSAQLKTRYAPVQSVFAHYYNIQRPESFESFFLSTQNARVIFVIAVAIFPSAQQRFVCVQIF